MKITMIYNTVCAFATQRNATQRNANQNYILNNNFKFYISKFFRAVNFLSAVFGFAKISSFIKEKQNLCSFFYREKRTKKAASFVKRSKTTPFRIRNSLVKIFSQYSESPSFAEGVLWERGFAEAIYINWIATPSLRSARNDKFNYIHAFSCALKNQFEIISQLNYGFCYKNYFFNLNQVFRNSYDFGENYDFGRNLNYDFEKNCSGGFGKNYFWDCNFGFDFGNEIYSIGNNLKGFLFNRKTKKNKFMSAF